MAAIGLSSFNSASTLCIMFEQNISSVNIGQQVLTKIKIFVTLSPKLANVPRKCHKIQCSFKTIRDVLHSI